MVQIVFGGSTQAGLHVQWTQADIWIRHDEQGFAGPLMLHQSVSRQVFKLFVRGDKQNPISFKGERTLRGQKTGASGPRRIRGDWGETLPTQFPARVGLSPTKAEKNLIDLKYTFASPPESWK